MRYVMYTYEHNKMAAAGSETQLLPLGKFNVWYQRTLCSRYYKGTETKSISIRLSTVVQKGGKGINAALKSCSLLHPRAPKNLQLSNFKIWREVVLMLKHILPTRTIWNLCKQVRRICMLTLKGLVVWESLKTINAVLFLFVTINVSRYFAN